jgi:Tfp pilus assembly protein PilF
MIKIESKQKVLRLLIALISISTLIISCSTGQNSEFSDDIEEHLIHFRNGNVALNQANYNEAEKEFKAAISGYPNNAPYHNYLGLTYFLQNRFNEALVEFDTGLKITSEYGDLYNNKGLTLLAMGKSDEALNEFKKALNTPAYGTPETVYFNIGRIYYTKEQWVEAAFNFEKAIEIVKKKKGQPQPEALCFHGITLIKQGKVPESIAPLSEAVKANPKYLLAQYHLGIAYFATGDRDRALKHFLEVRTLSSVDDPLYKGSTEYINRIKQGN